VVKRVAVALLAALAIILASTTTVLAYTPGDRAAYPHTGTQIAIFAVVVCVLLVGGILLWYFSHPRKRK
jgi:drug/metabolite transporter (DMT)-like permease